MHPPEIAWTLEAMEPFHGSPRIGPVLRTVRTYVRTSYAPTAVQPCLIHPTQAPLPRSAAMFQPLHTFPTRLVRPPAPRCVPAGGVRRMRCQICRTVRRLPSWAWLGWAGWPRAVDTHKVLVYDASQPGRRARRFLVSQGRCFLGPRVLPPYDNLRVSQLHAVTLVGLDLHATA